jgi:nitronate monooxygenase
MTTNSSEPKTMWPDRRLLNLFKTEFTIVLAPMAGAIDADLAIAVAQGGGPGSVPCAMLSVERAREQINIIRQRVSTPINVNFFCHTPVEADAGSALRLTIGNWGSIRRRP